jgi:nitrate reductase assembly molybdenum cofactor insertion protein NarJ
VRKVLLSQTSLKEELKELSERLSEHNTLLNQIYDALENLIDEKASQRKWEARDRIGFSKE